MSLGKVARKLKRVGKTAYQFRFTSTFEYIELGCNGTWRPEKLRVIWVRNHRRVQSIDVEWKLSEDSGPNGAFGRGTFDPKFSVALLVTVYGNPSGGADFEEKEYKYYIESDGASGRKIVASFNVDVSEYADLNGSKHTLDMSFKPVSKKVNKAVLGITLNSEFIKRGNAIDDDMQSTFSAASAGRDSLQFDEEEEAEAVITPVSAQDKGIPQASGDKELVTLGTGECLKRTTLPDEAPKKPERHGHSPFNTPILRHKEMEVEPDKSKENTEGQTPTGVVVEEEVVEEGLMYMNLNAEGDFDSAEGELDEPPWEGDGEEGEGETGREPREQARDRRTSRRARKQREKLEREREKQEERERRQREKKEEKERKLKEKSKSPPPADVTNSPAIPPREKSDTLTNGVVDREEEEEEEEEEYDEESALRASKVLVTQQPTQVTACGQPVDVVFDTSSAGEGALSAVCKGTKSTAVDTTIVQEETSGHYRVQFTPRHADVFMLSVRWGRHAVPGSPFLINLNLLPSAACPESSEGVVGTEGGGDQTVVRENGVVKGEGEGEGAAREESTGGGVQEGKRESKVQEMREKSPVIVVSDEDPFNMAYEASRMLEERQLNHTSDVPPSKPGRKVVASREEWTKPVNHVYEDMPAAGDDAEAAEEEARVSPLDAWLCDGQFSDCFGETVSREKLESADIIGLYFSANWCPPCRRFLPKLVKFYHHLKQNQKSFELLYISSDYSKQEMTKYMQEQQMPWLALAFDSTISDKLRADYAVSAIPILTIVNKEGVKLEEGARKAVEQATSSSAILKLYNKWAEKSQQLQSGEGEREGSTEKKGGGGGLLKTIKSAINKKEASSDSGSTGTLESQKSLGDASDSEGGGRITVEQRSRARTKQKLKESSSLGPTREEMEEKEEKLRHLEEVNMSLKQTNDDLNEEVAELKRQIGEFQSKLTMLEQSSKQLEDEKRELIANLNIRGWLLKRGIKGPTANVWRRRYFRCDQGSKIYYYKAAAEGTPQGFIDLDLVVSVQEISPAQQDKNHATFLVQCEGRTYQLQAHDETTMRKWMSAIEYLKNWRQRNSTPEAGP